MKKILAVLAAVMLIASFALAEETLTNSEIFEFFGEVLTVRFPETEPPYFAFYTGRYTMELLAEGETAEGITAASYILPEEARAESQLFSVLVDLSGGEQTDVRSALIGSFEGGELYCMGTSRTTPDFYTDCSEGYEYSEGRTLQISLPGSPATGYEWTLIPDNSGVLELADSYEIDKRASEEDPLVTAMGFFFLPAENPAGKEGSMIFTLDRAPEDEEAGKLLEFRVTLDDAGEIADVIRVR